MQRVEPTISNVSIEVDPNAVQRRRMLTKLRQTYNSLLGWLAVLFILLALIVAGAGYAVLSGLLSFASQVGHPEFIYPLAGLCALAAFIVTYGKWLGLGFAAATALAVASYLLLYSPRYGGGLLTVGFIFLVVCYTFFAWRRST